VSAKPAGSSPLAPTPTHGRPQALPKPPQLICAESKHLMRLSGREVDSWRNLFLKLRYVARLVEKLFLKYRLAAVAHIKQLTG
jgi:transposase